MSQVRILSSRPRFFKTAARRSFFAEEHRFFSSSCEKDRQLKKTSLAILSTTIYYIVAARSSAYRGCSSLVEPQPSKLMRRVRFPSPAPDCTEPKGLPSARLFSCPFLSFHRLEKPRCRLRPRRWSFFKWAFHVALWGFGRIDANSDHCRYHCCAA